MKNLSLRVKILIVAIPLVIALIASTIVGVVRMKQIESQTTEIYYDTLFKVTDLVINADRDFYQALVAHMNFIYKKDASPEDQKGFAADVEENAQQTYDRIHEALDIAKGNEELYGGTYEGKVMSQLGTDFDTHFEKVKAELMKAEGPDEAVINSEFDAARDAIDGMGEVVEKWAEAKHEDVTGGINRSVVIMAVVFGIVIIGFVALALVLIHTIIAGIKEATLGLTKISEGDLQVEINMENAGRDEVGQIKQATYNLAERLKDIISKTKNMSGDLNVSGGDLADSADQATAASNQVSIAVNEVSEGAVSQSESVQTAADRTEVIGDNIEKITGDMSQLNEFSQSMKESCDTTMNTLNDLIESNSDVYKSVHDIGETISATNKSVENISNFSDAIMDIASQTNLLSLNASIEAARAGESGRGFAVVADEIRQLADQSRESADEIKTIIDTLLADTEASVGVMDELNKSITTQGEQITTTKAEMEDMSENVTHVFESADMIRQRVENLNNAKQALVEIIGDLTAVSEENAASSEESAASMEELNATFTTINDAAAQLRVLAEEMDKTISFFTV